MTALTIQEREAPLIVDLDQEYKNEINRRQDCVSLADYSVTSEESHESLTSTDPVTVRRLIFGNRHFRLFISSSMLARLGGWLTYVASITLIEDIMHLGLISSEHVGGSTVRANRVAQSLWWCAGVWS